MRLPLLLFFLLLFALPARAQPGKELLKTPFSPGIRKGRVADFINDIRRKTGFSVSFTSAVLDTTRRVFIPRQTSDLKAIFELVLSGQNVEAVESHGTILLVPREVSSNSAGAYRVITGRLREKGSGEVLIGAVVYDASLQVGTTTNAYGLYQLSVPEGIRTICASSVGFIPDTFRIPPAGNYRHDADLESNFHISEVTVSGRDKPITGERSQFYIRDSRPSPAALGDVDVMNELQQLPGVQAPYDGSSGILVRGGNPGQNLHLLDGVPLYFVEHFFGLTSVYNSDALKSVDFYKSTYPARYGGRISSVIDAHGRDGDLEKVSGQASVGLLKASVNIGGPIIKDRMSVMVSARRSWIDGLLRALPQAPTLYYYDANGKIQWLLNKNHRLYMGLYTGRDLIRSTVAANNNQRLRWTNTVGSLRWNAVFSPKVLFDATATYSSFSFDQRDRNSFVDSLGVPTQNEFTGTSSINEFSVSGHVQWTPGQRHRAVSGFRFARAFFTPTTLERTLAGVPFITSTGLSSEFQSTELSTYAENTLLFGDQWMVRPGLNVTAWLSGGFQYISIQPRIHLSYRFRPMQSVFASLSRMGQFLHLLSNNSFGFSNNFWVPSTARIRPEESWNATLGWKKQFSSSLQLGVETYYRYLEGVLEYTTAQSVFDNSPNWQEKVAQGVGWAYGAEFSGRYDWKKWQFNGAYTLSRSMRQFSALNSGEPFPDRYDRCHNLNLRFTYIPSHRFDATAQWTYMTGEAFTIPDQLYADLDHNLSIGNAAGTATIPNSNLYTYNYSRWNDFRLPALHRLDLGANFTKRRGLRYSRTWSVGIYNAYGRPNISFVNLLQEESGHLYLQGISLFRFVPYAGLKVQF